MIFEDMAAFENMMPLDNILSTPNAADMQSMMSPQAMAPQSGQMPSLQEMLAWQNGALTQGQMLEASPPMMPGTAQNMAAQGNAFGRMQPRGATAAMPMQPGRGTTTTKAQAKQQLAQCCFAVHEAVLFLDTHPNDQSALEYYRRKQQQLLKAQEAYKKAVGPLRAFDVNTDQGGWSWTETPWPWELEEA